MVVVNMHEAKTHLSRLVERAAAGEEIVIAKAGKPVAKLVPHRERAERRLGGTLRGKISYAPDWDSAEVEEQIVGLFEGEDDWWPSEES